MAGKGKWKSLCLSLITPLLFSSWCIPGKFVTAAILIYKSLMGLFINACWRGQGNKFFSISVWYPPFCICWPPLYLFYLSVFELLLPLNSQLTLSEPRLIKPMGICFWQEPSEEAQEILGETLWDISGVAGGVPAVTNSPIQMLHGWCRFLKNNQATGRGLSNNFLKGPPWLLFLGADT